MNKIESKNIDSIPSKVHQAKVRASSDSVLCLWHGSVSEASFQFANKRTINLKVQ